MKKSGVVTRKMVAAEAGVTETIVSYVLNNNRYVEKNKRLRVLETVKRLGYQPNAAARMLKLKKSNHLLFIADNIKNEHFGILISEIDRLLYDKGYFISLAKNRDNEQFVSHIINRQFDGVLISSISMREEYLSELANAGIPMVLLMNRAYRFDAPANVGYIYPGLYDGARQCVRHLHAGGCRNIVYLDRISARNHFSDRSDLRLCGFLDEMADLGCPCGNRNVISNCKSEEEVVGRIIAAVNDGFAIDGIAARNDSIAALAIKAANRLGLSIPKQISIIGFDNSTLSRNITPSITTMEMDRQAMAAGAVAMLEDLMQSKHPEPIRLATKLIVRDSTR